MKNSRVDQQNLHAAALVCAVALTAVVARAALPSAGTANAEDPLPSWNDGKAKQSIVAFVGKVTKAGSPDLVAGPERISE
jgi:hypothetical protein